jgi:hypothetical protein
LSTERREGERERERHVRERRAERVQQEQPDGVAQLQHCPCSLLTELLSLTFLYRPMRREAKISCLWMAGQKPL